jgi:predicted transposase YdaD
MGKGDLICVLEHVDRLYKALYGDYIEFMEADEMLKEKFVYKWQEIEERARKEAQAEAQAEARKVHEEKIESARILKGMGLTPEQIQTALKLSPGEIEGL